MVVRKEVHFTTFVKFYLDKSVHGDLGLQCVHIYI